MTPLPAHSSPSPALSSTRRAASLSQQNLPSPRQVSSSLLRSFRFPLQASSPLLQAFSFLPQASFLPLQSLPAQPQVSSLPLSSFLQQLQLFPSLLSFSFRSLFPAFLPASFRAFPPFPWLAQAVLPFRAWHAFLPSAPSHLRRLRQHLHRCPRPCLRPSAHRRPLPFPSFPSLDEPPCNRAYPRWAASHRSV